MQNVINITKSIQNMENIVDYGFCLVYDCMYLGIQTVTLAKLQGTIECCVFNMNKSHFPGCKGMVLVKAPQ